MKNIKYVFLLVYIVFLSGCMSFEPQRPSPSSIAAQNQAIERQRGIEAIEREDQLKSELLPVLEDRNIPILITELIASKPNSAGGVDLTLKFINLTEKPIKYLIIQVAAYNRVDDRVICTVRNRPLLNGRATGPYEPGKESNGVWRNAWYNHSVHHSKLVSYEIEFMDGTIVKIDNEDDVRLSVLYTPLEMQSLEFITFVDGRRAREIRQ